jgi:hypothetical protein
MPAACSAIETIPLETPSDSSPNKRKSSKIRGIPA